MSAFASGALMIACSGGDLGMKFYSRQVLRRFGFRNTLVVNGVLVAITVAACATFTAATPIAVIAIVLFAIGLVRSVQFGAFNALTYVDVPGEKMSSASSLASTVQQMSFGLGVAFGALALHLVGVVESRARRSIHGRRLPRSVHRGRRARLIGAYMFGKLDPHAGAESKRSRCEFGVDGARELSAVSG